MPPSITIFIYTHHGIISAIGVEVEAVYRVRIEIGSVIYGDESANFRIVIAGVQVVQAGFGIVIVSAITERVHAADMHGIVYVHAVCILYRVISPNIVCSAFRHLVVADYLSPVKDRKISLKTLKPSPFSIIRIG